MIVLRYVLSTSPEPPKCLNEKRVLNRSFLVRELLNHGLQALYLIVEAHRAVDTFVRFAVTAHS